MLFYGHFKINKVTCTHLSLYLGSFSFTLRRDVQQRAIQCTQHISFTIHLYTMFPLHPLYIHTQRSYSLKGEQTEYIVANWKKNKNQTSRCTTCWNQRSKYGLHTHLEKDIHCFDVNLYRQSVLVSVWFGVILQLNEIHFPLTSSFTPGEKYHKTFSIVCPLCYGDLFTKQSSMQDQTRARSLSTVKRWERGLKHNTDSWPFSFSE